MLSPMFGLWQFDRVLSGTATKILPLWALDLREESCKECTENNVDFYHLSFSYEPAAFTVIKIWKFETYKT